MKIFYTFHSTDFGTILVATVDDAVCYLAFVDTSHEAAVAGLHRKWPNATYTLFPDLAMYFDKRSKNNQTTSLHFHGTDFQTTVWKELLNIPVGTTVSYSTIAQRIGKPKAVRAVARAIAQNHIALLIPCHRVITKSGHVHHYRWGSARKKLLLDWEKSAQQKITSYF